MINGEKMRVDLIDPENEKLTASFPAVRFSVNVSIVGPGLNPFSPPNQLRVYVQEVGKRLPISIVTNKVASQGIHPNLEQVEVREGLFPFFTLPVISKLQQLNPNIIDVEGSLTQARLVPKISKFNKPIIFGVHNLDKLFFSDIKRQGARRFLSVMSGGRNSKIPNWMNLLNFCYPTALLRKNLQCKMIKRIILPNRYVANSLSKMVDPEKFSIISHGVDTKRFAPKNMFESRARLHLDSNDIAFLYYGSHRMLRGIDKLILSFNQMRMITKSHNPKLLLVMPQPAPYYEQLIHSLNLEKHVNIFYGIQKNIERFIDAADIVCFPFECVTGVVAESPYTILESMSMGKPVISTRVGAIPEIISNKKNGLIVNAGDIPDLTLAMLNLASDEKLRKKLGREARNLMVEKYDWDIVISRLKAVYEEVAACG
jgi:glycosyltransferase involved in cell wall biosynthesis